MIIHLQRRFFLHAPVLPLCILFTALIISVSGCNGDNKASTDSLNQTTAAPLLPEVPAQERVLVSGNILKNQEAPIPPQCYTKTEGSHNPCYVCHQLYSDRNEHYRMNRLDDGGIQGGYLFSDIGITNHWTNLFVDRQSWVDNISDEQILTYINQDNYSTLSEKLNRSGWKGFIPDLADYERAGEAFNADGTAKDGSHWVAFNYKPMPSTFWPTNGSTDDVVIRLPPKFRSLNGTPNLPIYKLNLAILEMSMKGLQTIAVPDINELALQTDLNQDGTLSESLSEISARTFYVGDASEILVQPQQFPQGTELMHSVRYVGVTNNGEIVVPKRMKELRYMEKVKVLSDSELTTRYDRERKEKLQEELPYYVDHGDRGFSNGMGWLVQGFIEDYDGELRPQTYEEKMACMGCHSAIGTTIDNTFAFARKVTGPAGWGYIDLRNMKDAPSISERPLADSPDEKYTGEIFQYLQTSGGGNEFRDNPEMLEKWFHPTGQINDQAVKNADVYELITPTKARALQLNKAYTHIVRHQSFIHGRDATIKPPHNVFETIDESVPPLQPESRLMGWDIRLNWQ